MTSKERFSRAISFKETDRLPFNFWADRRLLDEYSKVYGEDFRCTYYDADVIESFPQLAWPSGDGVWMDGSYWFTEPPLIADWSDAHKLQMPDPKDEAVYKQIEQTLAKHPDRAVIVNIPCSFTILHGMRLMDNLFYDVYDEPDALHAMIKRIMDVQTEVIRRVVKLPISGIYFQDDIASSDGLMFSVDMCKEFVLDYITQGIEIAKNAELPVLYHSDGAVMDILDTLVDIGIDAVNPLQPDFNDFTLFGDRYSGKLAVYGGIDNTKVIPFGNREDISRHIDFIYDKLGKNGGLIFSSHDIPYGCPKENIDFMVECIKGLHFS